MTIGKIIDGKAFAAGLRDKVADGVAAFAVLAAFEGVADVSSGNDS